MIGFAIFGLFAVVFSVIYDANGHKGKALYWLALGAICVAVLIVNNLIK